MIPILKIIPLVIANYQLVIRWESLVHGGDYDRRAYYQRYNLTNIPIFGLLEKLTVT